MLTVKNTSKCLLVIIIVILNLEEFGALFIIRIKPGFHSIVTIVAVAKIVEIFVFTIVTILTIQDFHKIVAVA